MSEKDKHAEAPRVIADEAEGRKAGIDAETLKKMGAFYADTAEKEKHAERVFQFLHKGFDPIIEENIKKQKDLQKKEEKIKNLRPLAERGRKNIDATSKGGYAKKKQYEEMKQSLLQEMADNHWNKNPGLPNRNVAIKISKEINTLISKGEPEEPLKGFFGPYRHPKFDTIRKLIKNPHKK